MGCDIHFYVERREGAAWVTCDQWRTETDDGQERRYVDHNASFYHDRNYDLFAIFADVRNGRGFAGVKTGEGFVPIAAPRGIPDDCSADYRQVAEAYGEDGHSHSWLTVAEILSFDWTQITSKRGIVGPNGWAQWKLQGQPRGWSASIDGGGVMHVSLDDMASAANAVAGDDLWRLVHDGSALRGGPLSKAVYQKLGGAMEHGIAVTEVTWSEPYYATCGGFLGATLPRLWRLGKPEDVRAVFFFDN